MLRKKIQKDPKQRAEHLSERTQIQFILDEQQLKMNAYSMERQKLLAEISLPISTISSLAISIALLPHIVTFVMSRVYMQDINDIVHQINQVPTQQHRVRVLEEQHNQRLEIPLDQFHSAVQAFDENKNSDRKDVIDTYQMIYKHLSEILRAQRDCARLVKREVIPNRDINPNSLSMTELYNYILLNRKECFKDITANVAEGILHPYYQVNILMGLSFLTLKFGVINPLVKQLFIKHNQDERLELSEDKSNFNEVIRALQTSNQDLNNVRYRNKKLEVMACLLLLPIVVNQLFSLLESPSELTMVAVIWYLGLFYDVSKHCKQMHDERILRFTIQKRKNYIESAMPIDSAFKYTITTHEGQLADTTFFSLKTSAYEKLDAAQIAQIVKQELTKQGLIINQDVSEFNYDDNVIVINGNTDAHSCESSEIQANILNALDAANNIEQLINQIDSLAKELRDETGQNEIKAVSIPSDESDYYSCYIRVPAKYNKIINLEILRQLFPDAKNIELTSNHIFKITAAKPANYKLLKNLKIDIATVNRNFKTALENTEMFKLQLETLSQHLDSPLENAVFSYDDNGFPIYQTSFVIPPSYAQLINKKELRALFPDAEVQQIENEFIIFGSKPANTDELGITIEQIKKKGQSQSDNTNNQAMPKSQDTSNAMDKAKASNNPIKTKPVLAVIDFGNGLTYNPNIGEGCQFLQVTTEPRMLDTSSFGKCAYVLFNDAIYYYDKIDNKWENINLNNLPIQNFLSNLNVNVNPSNNNNNTVLVLKELTRKDLQYIHKVTKHDHHAQDVVPFDESKTSFPKCKFFCKRVRNTLTVNDYIKAGVDASVAEDVLDRFDAETDCPTVANGRVNATGFIFEHGSIKKKDPNTSTSSIIDTDGKIKLLGSYGVFGKWRTYLKKENLNGYTVFTPVGVKGH